MSIAQRTTYRHGDLRQALLDAGIDMAREGGPDAVVLREATRRTGVSPNAAYRHFADRDALVSAVSDAASAASAAAIEAEWDAVPAAIPGRDRARAPPRRRRRLPAIRARRARAVPRRLHRALESRAGLQPRQGGAGRPHPVPAARHRARRDGRRRPAARRSAGPAPSSARGRRCTGSRCSCSRVRCATSTRRPCTRAGQQLIDMVDQGL